MLKVNLKIAKSALCLSVILGICFLPLPNDAHAQPFSFQVSPPALRNLTDQELAEAAINTQSFLSVKVMNVEDRTQLYVVLIEVRNAEGITTYLQFQKGEIRERAEIELGSSWTPHESGNYQLRVFVISNLEYPSVLSPVAISNIRAGLVELRQENGADDDKIEDQDSTTVTPEIDELRQYAVQQINKDREEFDLAPVQLSLNGAAQIHAEDVFETKKISHWMTNGEKPYMTYSRYGGEGYVGQNVATSGDKEYYTSCVSGLFLCEKTDPYREIDTAQYGMMYDDEECCDNGHRDNILDKHHTHVSIGIAYDDYFFALVQNFEDQYIDWTDRINEEGAASDTVSMSGYLQNNRDTYSENDVSFDGIEIYYDPLPSRETYDENYDEMSYTEGEFIAVVVEPAMHGYYYEDPTDYVLIEAEFWRITDSEFQVVFKTDDLQKQYGEGVYTVGIWCKDYNDEYFLASSVSIFKN